MDLIDKLKDLNSRFIRIEGQLATEEATKNALVMPFINALGYNVFDPTEVVPEFTADVGTKKGEKVDYAIMRDGKPSILIECKCINTNLDKEHASQLYRYFSVTDARFSVLTDGVEYRFFTDLEQPNKMDARPFLEFNLRSINESIVSELKKFTKESFDLENILSTASELKYTKGIKRILGEEWINPSEEFVRLFTSRVYSGRMTQAVRDQFTQLTKKAFHEFVSDHINMRLKSALERESSNLQGDSVSTEKIIAEGAEELKGGIETTADELEGYYIVKSILREMIDPNRVFLRDTQTYCGILLDDNNRKPICRLFFNGSQQYVGTFDEEKKIQRHPIMDLNDIYKLGNELKATVKFYESNRSTSVVTSSIPTEKDESEPTS